METKNKLITLDQLYSDSLGVAGLNEQFNLMLNAEPKKEWISEHPIIKVDGINAQGQKIKVPYKYLAIDKVEYLLRKIFIDFSIEIISQGTAFNGVWVTVRVHFTNPVTKQKLFHDGIGASQLQTKSGTSPADLLNINSGAISMAFPMAKTLAVKDACDHFGTLFGANLNRRNAITYTADKVIYKKTSKVTEEERLNAMLNDCATLGQLQTLQELNPNLNIDLFEIRKAEIINNSK